jgi:hypothetical protein
MSNTQSLELTINVPADEWAYCHRRLTYLETLLLRVVRDADDIQEWYTSFELADQQLPGLPVSAAAITRKAKAAGWQSRPYVEGGKRRLEYHVTSLPARAFDTLIARILDMPELDGEEIATLPALPAVPKADAPQPAVTAPAWVLPLMRLVKGEAAGDLGRAWRSLPEHVPAGTPLPSVDEAASVLIELGLADRLAR